jgi:hypothetical protein
VGEPTAIFILIIVYIITGKRESLFKKKTEETKLV